MNKTLVKYITLYEELGLVYIPIGHRTKIPSVDWKKYQTTPPTPDEKNSWFKEENNSIAVICGAISKNLVVVDFDKENLMEEFFDKSIIEKTFVTKTSRGYHVYLRTKNPTQSRKIPGMVDILGEGKIAIAPPSEHPNGGVYKHNGVETILEVYDFDKIFWEKAKKLGYYQERGLKTNLGTIKKLPPTMAYCIKKILNGVGVGKRNDAGFALACFFKNQDYTIKQIGDSLYKWNDKNTEPLERAEIERIVDSVKNHTYGLGCSTPILHENCTSEKGECPFQDMLELIKENTEEVRIIRPLVEGDPYVYEIVIMGKTLKIDSKYMLTSSFFKRRWLEEHGKLITLSDKKWRELINYWSEIATYEKNKNPSTDEFVRDAILEKLSECDVTTDKNLAVIQRSYFYVESVPFDMLLYPTKGIKDIIDSTKLKTDISRVHSTLKREGVTHTKVVRVGNKTMRFWAFKPDFLGIEWGSRIKEDVNE